MHLTLQQGATPAGVRRYS